MFTRLILLLVSCAVFASGYAHYTGDAGRGARALPGVLQEEEDPRREPVSLRSAWAGTGHGLVQGRDERQDILIVDAGSSGSKVFAFTPDKTTATFYTECCKDLERGDRGKLHGVAALAYSKAECEWQVGDNAEHLEPLGGLQRYANLLLQSLATTYKAASGKIDMTDVVASQDVPILATAGMRLVSQAANDRIWSVICGRAGSGLAFASRGEHCGTIPGTTEAYYEFLANAANGESRTLTGTFTVGGASSQIAIPLRTEADVAAFDKLRADIEAELDCTAITLADGQLAPIFSARREGGPRTVCLDDYISIRLARDINVTAAVQQNIRLSDIRGVGMISFLGLEGRGTFVAGGIGQIERWAEHAGCVGNQSSFADCNRKLREALAGDLMWNHVTAFFRRSALNIHDFSYNTYAAVPEEAGFPGVSGQKQGWELEAELKQECGADNSIHFGYEHSNTCMKALYTSLYITSFFTRSSSVAHAASGEDSAVSSHNETELHFDPKRDWVEGVREVEIAEMGSALLQESGGQHAHHLLRVPLRRMSSSYADGVRLHLGR